MHQRRAVIVSAGAVRHRMNDRTRLVGDLGDDRDKAVDFLPAVGEAFEENRYVVI